MYSQESDRHRRTAVGRLPGTGGSRGLCGIGEGIRNLPIRRQAKFKGTVLLRVEIDSMETATNIKVHRGLGLRLE
jgi:hypothetical protein